MSKAQKEIKRKLRVSKYASVRATTREAEEKIVHLRKTYHLGPDRICLAASVLSMVQYALLTALRG